GGGYRAGFDTGSVLVNCTFAKNLAGTHGGGFSMSRDAAGPAPRDSELRNCILWANTKSACGTNPCSGGQIEIFGEGNGQHLLVNHCDVQGGSAQIIDVTPAVVTWDSSSFNQDPQLVSLTTGDLRPSYLSPCVNSGTADAFPQDDADV